MKINQDKYGWEIDFFDVESNSAERYGGKKRSELYEVQEDDPVDEYESRLDPCHCSGYIFADLDYWIIVIFFSCVASHAKQVYMILRIWFWLVVCAFNS